MRGPEAALPLRLLAASAGGVTHVQTGKQRSCELRATSSRDGGSVDGDRSIDSPGRDSPGDAEIENETDYYGVALRGIVRSGSRNSMESSVSGGRSVATGGALQ